MKYCLKDNQLLILYENGKIKENATENDNECKYCQNKRQCERKEVRIGGSGCDFMKCIYEEGQINC
jgi:hypothetical protein